MLFQKKRKNYLYMTKKMLLMFCSLQYFILTMIFLILEFSLQLNEFLEITYILSIYTFFLIIEVVLLSFDQTKLIKKLINLFFHLVNICFIVTILAFSGNDNFISQILIYITILSILFETGYLNSFVKHLGYCSIIYLFILIK